MLGLTCLRIITLAPALLLVIEVGTSVGQVAGPASKSQHAAKSNPVHGVCSACIRADEEFLASDAMRGRGSGTHDEEVAATYIASQLRRCGIEPAGDSGGYIQRVPIAAKAAAGSATTQTDSETASPQEKGSTSNVIGIVRGTNPTLRRSALLLSAHLDHLGVGQPENGDSIYNGADDDASGVTAVLELARVLGRVPHPQRTVIFALFGSEETGGLGSTYFRAHPPVPLSEIAVNLEFEMIGRRDPAVKGDELWLTGWERSNLGPALAARGARLVADPHSAQHFFTRSDNYGLAKEGVVAQTISSFGLHADYHKPSDDLAHLDFKHLDAAIRSLIKPIEWLANSDFRPQWNEGGRP